MINYSTALNEISDLKFHMKLSGLHYIDIQLDKGLVSIENRQSYCDRGRFIVKVFSDCVKTFYVDHQDAFPRYYFSFDNLLSEIYQWFEARKVNVLSIDKKTVST